MRHRCCNEVWGGARPHKQASCVSEAISTIPINQSIHRRGMDLRTAKRFCTLNSIFIYLFRIYGCSEPGRNNVPKAYCFSFTSSNTDCHEKRMRPTVGATKLNPGRTNEARMAVGIGNQCPAAKRKVIGSFTLSGCECVWLPFTRHSHLWAW